MAQRLVFIADRSYATQAALNTQLDTLHSANPIVLLSTHGNSFPDQWARAWAQSKGVAWYDRGTYLDSIGLLEPAPRSLAHMLFTNPDRVLTAGSNAHTIAAAATANKRGHNLSQI